MKLDFYDVIVCVRVWGMETHVTQSAAPSSSVLRLKVFS